MRVEGGAGDADLDDAADVVVLVGVSDRTTRPPRRPARWRCGGAGDAYFPYAGNGRFDVRHYDVDLRYSPPDPAPAPLVGHLDVTGRQRETTDASLLRQREMIAFFESRFGTYPFNSYGSIVDDDTVGYALDTQTRPVYSLQANEGTVAHGLAHQWLGNAVSPPTVAGHLVERGLGDVRDVDVDPGARRHHRAAALRRLHGSGPNAGVLGVHHR